MSYYKRRYRKKKTYDVVVFTIALIILLYVRKINQNSDQLYLMIRWAFIILMVSIFSFYITKIVINEYKKQKKKTYYLNSSISQIDQMSGEEFEELLKAHFEKQGYKVNLTQKTNDYGADLILQKNGVKTIVQAKRHKQKIGNRAVQEIVAAKGHYKAAHGMVISNSYYSANCVKLAVENDIVLWSRKDLIEKFQIK